MDTDLSTTRPNSIQVRGDTFDLLPERCVFQRSSRTLLAADLHWGKPETFQSYGLALPSTAIDDDLRRLSRAIDTTGAERLLVLGDLIHTPKGITDGVRERIENWRAQHPRLTFQMIRGNHDRRFIWPTEWGIEDVGTCVQENGFLFTHDEPVEDVDDFVWMGHVHPVVELRGGGDRLRLPCFVVDDRKGLLPAFSAFTGGVSIGGRVSGRRVFAVADTAVLEV